MSKKPFQCPQCEMPLSSVFRSRTKPSSCCFCGHEAPTSDFLAHRRERTYMLSTETGEPVRFTTSEQLPVGTFDKGDDHITILEVCDETEFRRHAARVSADFPDDALTAIKTLKECSAYPEAVQLVISITGWQRDDAEQFIGNLDVQA